MNTPAHLIFGLAAFGKPNAPRVNAAALAGAVLPDLSLYILAGWHLRGLGTPADIVFGQLYFSDAWQSIFRIDNSMVLWGIALVIGLIWRAPVMIALCGAAMLHLGLDFLLHNDDGRAHFWPISTWIFESPVSYWDGDHYGNIVGPLEVVLCLFLSRLLWQRFTGWGMRFLIVALMVAEAAPVVIFWIMFGGSA
ncbi:cobalamin biosynthesis protein CobQ [Cognatiyoonia sp. IB215182]|uniref:cobalamin biosynthesis protein CobQ n=1 Tax=Cognatiyoonia sp. IB215182 TaxID=3097353 RepID=UPI002A1309C7|nr:cobalamin biosynthesis protein CobQ [Cognatiyoonia sp. IB215182]MDX8353864.1 cobalamin biosynthesis protein CobQ [Cognatiyoonia sp. IB215182]